MAYYRTCPHCGAHLDPEEQCDCRDGKVHYSEYVRADDLRSVNGLEIEFAAFEITDGTAALAAGDVLVFGADGMLVKAADAAGYAVSFKVIEKTAYMDDGILAEIVAQ